jgi:threonine/homoserine/homoserine lactone efflux protein
MLSQAIGGVLAAAVAVALSPIPIIAVILVLGTPRARSNGPAFALGWIVGLVVVSVVVLVAAHGASDPDSATSTGVNWLKLGLGLAFLSGARRQWRKRPRKGAEAEEAEMPSWMGAVDKLTPVKSLGVGGALSAVNPKNLVLTAAAAASIAQAGVSVGGEVVAVAVFVVISSITVAGAVLFFLVASDRAAAPLAKLKDFMAEHNGAIMAVLFLVLGAKLIGDGLGGVWR